MERRKFLAVVVTGTGLVIGGIVGIPAVVMMFAPGFRTRGPIWRPLGLADEFGLNEVSRATVEVPRRDWAESMSEKAVYVWRTTESDFVVYSRNCTDLSCPVRWDVGSERFFCPCHGGIFTKEGEVVAGPPRRPLWRYATRVIDGRLEIDVTSVPPMG